MKLKRGWKFKDVEPNFWAWGGKAYHEAASTVSECLRLAVSEQVDDLLEEMEIRLRSKSYNSENDVKIGDLKLQLDHSGDASEIMEVSLKDLLVEFAEWNEDTDEEDCEDSVKRLKSIGALCNLLAANLEDDLRRSGIKGSAP